MSALQFNDRRLPVLSCEAVLPASVKHCDCRPRSISWRSSILRLFAVSLLAVLGSSSASATCGDYLHQNRTSVGHSGDPIVDPAVASSNHAEFPGFPAPPCRGPDCSSRRLPFTPVPVVPMTLVPGFDEAAIIAAIAQVPSPLMGREIPESERVARAAPAPVFRPPMS